MTGRSTTSAASGAFFAEIKRLLGNNSGLNSSGLCSGAQLLMGNSLSSSTFDSYHAALKRYLD